MTLIRFRNKGLHGEPGTESRPEYTIVPVMRQIFQDPLQDEQDGGGGHIPKCFQYGIARRQVPFSKRKAFMNGIQDLLSTRMDTPMTDLPSFHTRFLQRPIDQ